MRKPFVDCREWLIGIKWIAILKTSLQVGVTPLKYHCGVCQQKIDMGVGLALSSLNDKHGVLWQSRFPRSEQH